MSEEMKSRRRNLGAIMKIGRGERKKKRKEKKKKNKIILVRSQGSSLSGAFKTWQEMQSCGTH